MTAFDEELPGLYLHRSALESNIAVMRAWCDAASVELAPHIKTTMTRAIVERQLAAGAWGVTVATLEQARLGAEWGARRIIIANELVTPQALRALAELVQSPQAPEYVLFIDSRTGIENASHVMSAAVPLPVLIDVGAQGGRTGVRSPADALALAREVADRVSLRLAGIAAYEGVRPNQRQAENLAAIDAHCDAALQLLEQVRPLITGRPLFTMGGSAFPDRVAQAIARHRAHTGPEFTAVLRSGCYVTHDHGTYAGVSPIAGLRPALGVRATVISAPEPGMVVVGAGRRELPFDAGLPTLLRAWDATSSPRRSITGRAERIFDHHLVLVDAQGLEIGDTVELGISHPCSAFDRWPSLSVLDDDDRLLERWPIRFHCD